MTYPLELREGTPPWDDYYPIRFYNIVVHDGRKDHCMLTLHWHESLEIIEMKRGRGVLYIDSHAYEAKPGDLFFIPSGALHVGYCLDDEPVEYVAIVFDQSHLRLPYPDPMHERYIAPFIDGRAQVPISLSADDERNEEIRRIVRETTDENSRQAEAYQLIVKSRFQQLYALLSRRFWQGQTVAPSSSPYSEAFKPLFREIELRFSNPLALEEAARLVSLNVFYFCKTFKKLTGRTYVDYVNWCRANEAEKLLRETKATITEISEKIGCGNVNYFTKLYKKYKGVPPSQTRK